jgi:hypothetical protein
MGEVVSRERHPLASDAAIKVSAAQFSERLARETKIVAGLNHPNICTLYDVGPNYLVMELVEGPTLTLNATAAGMILGHRGLHVARAGQGQRCRQALRYLRLRHRVLREAQRHGPHKGDTLQETLASVLKDEPDLNQVPAQAHRLLKRCLEKDSQKRLRHWPTILHRSGQDGSNEKVTGDSAAKILSGSGRNRPDECQYG